MSNWKHYPATDETYECWEIETPHNTYNVIDYENHIDIAVKQNSNTTDKWEFMRTVASIEEGKTLVEGLFPQ